MSTPTKSAWAAGACSAALLLALGACNDASNENDPNDRDPPGSAGSTSAGAGSGASEAGSGGSESGAAGDTMAGDPGSDGGAAAASAGEDGASSGTGDAPSWSAQIHPLLMGSCAGCHAREVMGGPPRPGGPGEGGQNGPGKFAADDAAAAYAALGPYVVAGKPNTSVLYIKVSEDEPSSGGQRMPPALRQLEDAKIQAIHDWIAAGAKQD